MTKTKEKVEKKKPGVRVVYGGLCYVVGGKRGFFIFRRKDGKWDRMAFAQKGMILFDKVKGGIYTIAEFTENGANFGRFEATGEVTDDPELIEMITKAEIQYTNEMQEKNAIALMKKRERSFENMTLAELKKLCRGDYSLGRAVKQWVSNNL